MNKAFTKESDFDPGLEVSIRPRNMLPTGVKNYITPSGARRLRQEEAEHRADQHRLRELDEQIRWLGERVAGLEVIDPAQQNGDRRASAPPSP